MLLFLALLLAMNLPAVGFDVAVDAALVSFAVCLAERLVVFPPVGRGRDACRKGPGTGGGGITTIRRSFPPLVSTSPS